jgi:hypothetical protein
MDLLQADSINQAVEEKFGQRCANRVVLATGKSFISEQDYEVQIGQSLEKRVINSHHNQALADRYLSRMPRPEKIYPLGLGRKLVQANQPCGDGHEMACCAIYLAFTKFKADERFLFYATSRLGPQEHNFCMYAERDELPDHDWRELASDCDDAIIIDPWLNLSCKASQYGAKSRDILDQWERSNILLRAENGGEKGWIKPTRFYEALQESEVDYLRPDGRPARLAWA